MASAMRPLDYGRSFLIGVIPKNEVRFWIESRTRVIDERNGTEEDYVQAAACKSEDTFAAKNLFYEDNYDFTPIFGPKMGVIFRRKAWLNPNYKSCVPSDEMWGGQIYRLVEARDFSELTDARAVLEATHAFRPVVAQTEIWDKGTGLRVIMEYPVKTMNTRREDRAYQVDTGPVAFLDPSRRHERCVDGIALAFVAFNARHFADFVVEEPTLAMEPGESKVGPMVHHYSKRHSFECRNRLYAVSF